MHVSKFLKNLFSEWGSGLSGSCSIPLTIAAFYTDSHAQKLLYAVLAFVTGWAAAYRIWSREYQRAETEISRNERPELKIEIQSLLWDVSKEEKNNKLQVEIYAYLRVTNIRSALTTLKGATLCIETLGQRYTASEKYPDNLKEQINTLCHSTNFRSGRDGHDDHDITYETISYVEPLMTRSGQEEPFAQGIPQKGLLRFVIPDLKTEDGNPTKIVATNLSITLTDSFDQQHSFVMCETAIPLGEGQQRFWNMRGL